MCQAAEEEIGRKEEVRKQLDQITYQSTRIQEIQKHPATAINVVLRVKSLDLMTAMTSYLTWSLKYFQHGLFCTSIPKGWTNLLDNLGLNVVTAAEEYKKSTTNLGAAIVAYDQALITHVADIVVRIVGDTAHIRTIEEKRERNEFFQWLSPSYWDVEDIRINYLSQRTPGTLSWITELPEFKSWRTVSLESGPAALWLTGNPGVGKTMLAACIVEILVRAYPNVLYFFCQKTEARLRTIRDIITTLAYQLSQRIPEVRQQLSSLQLDDFSPTTIRSTVLLLSKLLEAPWPKSAPEIFVILDGLDECQGSSTPDNADVELLLSFLMKLPNCRILVTSRPDPAIGSVLSHVIKQIGVEYNEEDIEHYIAWKVATVEPLRDAFKHGKIFFDPVASVRARANGSFLWAKLVLSEAEKSLTLAEFRSRVLESYVPQGLSQLYQNTLDRLEDARLGRFAKEVLIWILGAERALELQELQNAVELSLDQEYFDFRGVLERNLQSSLIEIASPSGGSFVRIIHNSLGDFVNDPLRCKPPCFIDPSFIQSHLAEICMKHLSQSPKQSKFTGYAALNWMEHLNRAQEESVVTRHLFESFYDFFNNSDCVRQWLTEEILRDQSSRFYNHDIHTMLIGLRSWLTKAITSNAETISNQSSNSDEITEITSEKMIPDGQLAQLQALLTETAEPRRSQIISWVTRMVGSGTQGLHELIGSSLAGIWINTYFDRSEQIQLAFNLAWKCLYLSSQTLGDEDDQAWKQPKKDGKPLLWNQPRSPGDVIDVASNFGYDESNGTCSLNLAVALAEWKFDVDAVTYLEEAVELRNIPSRHVAFLGVGAWMDTRPHDALLYFELAYRKSPRFSGTVFGYFGGGPASFKSLMPMHFAAWGGYIEGIKMLKRAGEDVSGADDRMRRPVHYAACSGHVHALRVLKEDGADIFAPDADGLTPFHLAAAFGQLDVVTWLVENNADVSTTTKRGQNAVQAAGWNDNWKVVKWLINNTNVDVNIVTTLYAAFEGKRFVNRHFVEWLMKEKNADINAAMNLDRTGAGLLHHITSYTTVEDIKWLVEVVAPSKAHSWKDDLGNTMLHCAAEEGRIDVIKCLIEGGTADVNITNDAGETPSQSARKNGNVEAADYLASRESYQHNMPH